MFTQDTLQETIDRITKMEFYFDTIQKALEINPEFLKKEAPAGIMLQELIEYYENGQWMADYETDEAGLLPTNLKRGVLSEDGVYNLLVTIQSHANFQKCGHHACMNEHILGNLYGEITS